MTDKPNPLYSPLNDEEHQALRKEFREREYQRAERQTDDWRESKKIYAEQTHAVRIFALGSAVEHGKIFIRFMFLLNGGAMIALLALIGTIFGKSEGSTLSVVINFAQQIKLAFYFFIGGLIFASATAATAYINWSFVFRTYFNEGQTTAAMGSNNFFGGQDKAQAIKDFDFFDRWSDRTIWIAVCFGTFSLIAFFIGSIYVASSFSILGMS